MSRNKKRVVASFGILALLHRLDRVAEAHEKAGDIKGSQEADAMRYRLFKAMEDEGLFAEVETGDMQSLVEQALALSQEQVALLEEALGGEPAGDEMFEEEEEAILPPIEEKEELPPFLQGGKEGSASKASASASASKDSASKASGSKDSGSKASGSKDSGSKASGSKASGSKKKNAACKDKDSGHKSRHSSGGTGFEKGAWASKDLTREQYIQVLSAIREQIKAKRQAAEKAQTGYVVRRVK